MTIDEMNERKRELGYTDMRISEISGVPLSTVRKVLGGATKAPRYETIRALTKALEKPSKSPASPYSVVREAQPAYGSKKQGEYTLEDYLAIPDERRVELIDGVIYDMSSPLGHHQIIAGQIYPSDHRRSDLCGPSCLYLPKWWSMYPLHRSGRCPARL